jgi:hypothetical protein
VETVSLILAQTRSVGVVVESAKSYATYYRLGLGLGFRVRVRISAKVRLSGL